MDRKGQISIELIVVIAAVLIVSLIVIKTLKSSTKNLTKKETSTVSKVSKALKWKNDISGIPNIL